MAVGPEDARPARLDASRRSGRRTGLPGVEVTRGHRAAPIESTHACGVERWAPGEYGRWLRIIRQGINGRRIVPGDLPPPFEPAGYL